MKQLLFAGILLTGLAFGSSVSAQETKIKKEDDKLKAKTTSADGKEVKVKKEDDKIVIKGDGVGKNMVYPYTAEYSSQFAPGNPAHGKMILDMWKAWDDAAFERQTGYIADTIRMELPTGEVITGKDNFMNTSRQYRGMFTTVKSNVEVWIPLKSLDRNENWVAIWGREEDTDKDGKVTTQRLHEIWRINKDGKIDFMRQYSAQPLKQ